MNATSNCLRVRILIVDDSVVMRTLLRSVIAVDSSLEVAGTAADGESALQAIERLRPDLVLLDVEMPVMDGLTTLRRLRMRGHRVPVIMCSALTQRGAQVTIEALACGAADYVTKPAGQADRESALRRLAQDLIPKIKALASRPAPDPSELGLTSTLGDAPRVLRPEAQDQGPPAVVAIAVSTGGPAALDVVLPALPPCFPLPVLVVQHMPELFTSLLAERLNRGCRLKVREAEEGTPVSAGTISIARGNWHLEAVAANRPRSGWTAPSDLPVALHLSQGPPENHCRPSANVLFRSVAAVYGRHVLGVVLTGMGSDGLAGCRILRNAGSVVLAQDQATSTVWGMPGAVAAAGLANRVLPLSAIGPEIVRLAGRSCITGPAVQGSVA
ncbi:MAG TPA: chemotaxis response regulator protein-glutamate methylesterase [Terracidiphilus sp.]